MTGSKEQLMEQREFELMQSIPVTKSGIALKASGAVDYIMETGNPLDYAQTLSAMESFIYAVKKDERFVALVIEEAQKNSGRVNLASGTKIEVAEVGTKYDYSRDEDWAASERLISELREKQKAREDFLKKIPSGKQLIDDNGIVIGIGPAKSSTTSFKVTLSK